MGLLALKTASKDGGLIVRQSKRKFRIPPPIAESIRAQILESPCRDVRGLLLGKGERDVEVIAIRQPPNRYAGNQTANVDDFSRLLAESTAGPESERQLRPVGWYSSRAQGDLNPRESDYEFHRTLFLDRDLILFCELRGGADVRFAALPGSKPTLKAKFVTWSGRLGVAIFLLFVGAGVAALVERASAPAPAPRNYRKAQTEQPSEKLSRELAFQVEHNRRLEATLQILRDKAKKKEP